MWEIKTHSDTQVTKSISNWHLISNLLDPMFSQSCEGTTKDTGNEGQAEGMENSGEGRHKADALPCR